MYSYKHWYMSQPDLTQFQSVYMTILILIIYFCAVATFYCDDLSVASVFVSRTPCLGGGLTFEVWFTDSRSGPCFSRSRDSQGSDPGRPAPRAMRSAAWGGRCNRSELLRVIHGASVSLWRGRAPFTVEDWRTLPPLSYKCSGFRTVAVEMITFNRSIYDLVCSVSSDITVISGL